MLSVKANDESGELAVGEDELALAIIAVDEHARRPERNVDGHDVVGPRISCQWSTPEEMNSRHVPVGPNGLSQRWAWLFHKRLLRTAGSCARNGTRCGKVGGWRVMAPVFPELTRRPPPGFFVSQAPSLALRIPQRGVAKTSSIIRDYASLSAPFHSSGSIRRRRSSMVIVPCSIRWFATATISGQNTRVNSSARR
jgi:hypothetical protein